MNTDITDLIWESQKPVESFCTEVCRAVVTKQLSVVVMDPFGPQNS